MEQIAAVKTVVNQLEPIPATIKQDQPLKKQIKLRTNE